MNGGHSLGFGVAACLALCVGCDDEGELAIIVTTDMAVPADFDKLVWGIRFSSETSQTNELPIKTEFPLLLGVIGGPQSNEPVTVFVEGHRKDGKRVEREAKVLLDRSKVKEIEMPLEWLCSVANPACAGNTCKSGHCAAPTEAWTPTDYRERRTEACFPVSTCFEGKEEQFYDSSCEIKIANADSLNFAIGFPRTSGLSGFCNDALTECLIPLDRIDPDERLTSGERGGWHRKPGDGAVVLSQAICEQKHHIYSAPVTGLCPQKSRFVPTCEQSALCQEDVNACPPGFPPASPQEQEPDAPRWLGYVCSGKKPPRNGLVDCHPGEPIPNLDETGSSWCCRTGARFLPPNVTQNDPLLIDDMSGGSTVKLGARDDDRGDAMAGSWFTAPLGSNDVLPKPGTIFGYEDLEASEEPPTRTEGTRAACLSSTNGFMGHVAMAGFNFRVRASGGYGALDFDVSRYDGFSFSARNWDDFGASLELDVHVPNVQTATDDPACCRVNGDSSGCDDFQKSVTLTQDWRPFTVRWDELKQSPETWAPPQQRFKDFDPRVYGLSFVVKGGGPTVRSQPFKFCVADIRFIQTPETNPQRFKVDPTCPPKPQPDERLR